MKTGGSQPDFGRWGIAMTHSSFWPGSHGKTAGRDDFLAPALYVSIAIAIFAVVTQLLYAAGAVSLSTTQLLGIWLAAATLIVLLWAAYMIARASLPKETGISGERRAGKRTG
jgi:membrane protein implicated in regulation of membrane protease activity